MATYRVTLKRDPSISRLVRWEGSEAQHLIGGVWVVSDWAFGLLISEAFGSNWQWIVEEE